jgi:hypothetical protein
MTEMNLDHLPDVTSSPLRWTRQLAALPRALRFALLRLLRWEARYYLTIDGQVVARFVSSEDQIRFMTWLHQTHTGTFDYGYALGKEFVVAQHINAADAGEPRTQ